MTAYRFKCRKHGQGFWEVYFALSTYCTAESAALIARRWTREGKSKGIEWCAEECLPGDFDHPAQQKGG